MGVINKYDGKLTRAVWTSEEVQTLLQQFEDAEQTYCYDDDPFDVVTWTKDIHGRAVSAGRVFTDQEATIMAVSLWQICESGLCIWEEVAKFDGDFEKGGPCNGCKSCNK